MPQVAAFFIVAAKVVGAYIGISAATAAAIGTMAFQLAVSMATSALMGMLAPKPRGMEQGLQLTTKTDPAFPREVIVGIAPTGGSLAFEGTQGDENRHLWQIVGLSDAECDGVEDILCQGEPLEFDGDVTTGFRTCTSKFGDKLRVRVYLGTQTQTANAEILAAFPELDSNFRGLGVAYAVICRTYDAEIWSGGSELVFVMRGAKCYDPRTGLTVFTKNSALIAAQYLRGFYNNGVRVCGLGIAAADLPDADLEAAADECDELVDLAGGGTEPRYESGGVISSREAPRDIISHLVAAMAGKHIDRGGEIILLAGVARTSVMEIVEGELLAAGRVVAMKCTADDRLNAIVSTYVEPADGYQEAPLPPREDTAAIAADGDRLETFRAYRFVRSYTQGQRLDQIELRGARKEGYQTMMAPLWGFELTPGDWFTMASQRWGGATKYWEVETVELAIGNVNGEPSARCALTCRETHPSVFEWDETTDEIEKPGIAADPILPPPPLASLVDEDDRIITIDGLPLNAPAGKAVAQDVAFPVSSGSSTSIAISAFDRIYPGRTYELPSATLTGLSADTQYYIFWDVDADDYLADSNAATARVLITEPSGYIFLGLQRTQTGGGGYTPPPPPPPGWIEPSTPP